MPQYFKIQRFALGNAWASAVPLVVALDCSRIVIECEDAANAMAIRTDPLDPTTEKGIPAGMEFEIRSFTQQPPFLAGTIVAYMMAVAGAGPAVVSFTR